MHLKYTFELTKFSDEFIAVPVGDDSSIFHGVIKMNEPCAFIFDLLKEDTTEDAIVDAMKAIYDAPEEVLLADVQKYIQSFINEGILAY